MKAWGQKCSLEFWKGAKLGGMTISEGHLLHIE